MHPKKKWRPMVFYIITLEGSDKVFINKSTNPVTSVRHHFHKAYNENRPDYNSDFYVWLRSRPQEDFTITYCTEMPEYIDRRAHLTTLPLDAVLPPVVTYEELYERLCNDNTR